MKDGYIVQFEWERTSYSSHYVGGNIAPERSRSSGSTGR
jgi:hypothetical protein